MGKSIVARGLLLFSAWLACVQSCLALGLGELQVKSYLGQPFSAEIALTRVEGLRGNEILVRLASVETFREAGVDRSPQLSQLRFSVDREQRFITISSDVPMLEPVVELVVDVRWPGGRLARSYAALLGPTPGVAVEGPEQPAASEQPRAVQATYGPVRANETLSGIAERLLLPGASSDQMMLALLAANPSGFGAANVNTLRQGVVLRVPEAQEVLSVDAARARAIVAQHHQAFVQRQRQRLTTPKPVNQDTSREIDEVRRLEALLARREEERARLQRESEQAQAGLEELRVELDRMQQQMRALMAQQARRAQGAQGRESSANRDAGAGSAVPSPDSD